MSREMTKFNLINKLHVLEAWAKAFTSKEFAFDTEFTSLDITEQQLIGLSIYDGKFPPTFIQFNFQSTYTQKEKDPAGGRKKLDVEYTYTKTDAINWHEAAPIIRDLLDGAKVVTANGKVELKAMWNKQIDNFEVLDDVNIMSWMLNVTTPNDLKYNARKELGLEMVSYEDTVGMKVSNIDWNKVNFYEYGKYGARDAYATWLLRETFKTRMKEDESVWNCYRNIEVPLIPIIANAEFRGVEIDVPYLQKLGQVIAKDMEVVAEEIYEQAGCEFNIGSGKQLGEILFDRLGLPVISMTDKGGRQVNAAALNELAYREYNIAGDLLNYKKMQTLRSTFIDAIPEKVQHDGRLRGGFNQYGTETGRMSSNGPNLQNIPNDKRYSVKTAFKAAKGKKLINVDFSTIEIRIMAHESRDPVLTALLNARRDIHQETTDNVNRETGLSINRGQGKTLNFAVLYGMGAQSLMNTLNMEMKKQVKKGAMTNAEYKKHKITEKIAQKMIDGFYNSYKGFEVWGRQQIIKSTQTGWVYTLGGRRRPVPELRRKETYGAGCRMVVNTIIQGGAGDIMKWGAIKLNQMFVDKGYNADILLFVHDEYVIEVDDDQADKCLADVIHVLENIYPNCRVPILCEGGVYENWAGLKEGAKKKAAPKMTYNKMRILKLVA